MYTQICPLDGPRAFQPRQVRLGGSTMATMKIGPVWHMYDNRGGGVEVIQWEDDPIFVASPSGVMHGVREIYRERYRGVL